MLFYVTYKDICMQKSSAKSLLFQESIADAFWSKSYPLFHSGYYYYLIYYKNIETVVVGPVEKWITQPKSWPWYNVNYA